MLQRLQRIKSEIQRHLLAVWGRLKLVDWSGAILAIVKTLKEEDARIDSKYLVIKPRLLSDENVFRGVAALRAVLAFIPPAAIAAPILSLGEVGFKIWKKIALNNAWDELTYPPIDPNVLRLSIEIDPVLKAHFGHLILTHNWNETAISELEKIYNDFSFITSYELLQAKHPEVEVDYLKSRASRNHDLLQANIYHLEQEIKKASEKAEIDTNVREAIEALKTLFPAMRDWALFNSEGFNELVEIIDTVV